MWKAFENVYPFIAIGDGFSKENLIIPALLIVEGKFTASKICAVKRTA
jgi:hypothetical protein